MKKRVMLVYPPTGRLLREDRCQIPARNIVMSPLLPPMDLLSLAAVAERSGWRCKVVDYSFPGAADDLISDLRSFRPDLVLLTVTTPSLDRDLAFCASIKKVLPGVEIMARGAHFLLHAEDALTRYPDLDMVLRGEPEITFREILAGRDRRDIPGLTWRGKEGLISNPARPFLEDLDSLPLPARHLIDNSRYHRPDTGELQTVVKVSRGCPHHCFFCLATPLNGRRVRMRTPRSILGEIRQCVEQYGIHSFLFWSDHFAADRSWVLELCAVLQASGLDITWSANMRADAVDAGLARAMRASGCTLVSIGVESGEQAILDRIGKDLTIPQIRDAFTVMKQAGVATLAYYLIGLPWDTRETVEATIRLSLELDSDYASYFVATPLPGTRFHDYAVAQGLLAGRDASREQVFAGAYYRAAAPAHALSGPEITALRSKAWKAYHLRAGYIVRRLRSIRSWKELVNHIAVARSMLRNDV